MNIKNMKKHFIKLFDIQKSFFFRLLKNSLNHFLQGFLALLYPNRCPICGKIPSTHSLICPKCYHSITFVKQPFCYSCGKPLSSSEDEYCHDCKVHPKSFTRGYSLAVYNSVTRPSMAAIKYKNKRCYLDFYAAESLNVYGQIFSQLSFDAILPVPIHPKRMKKRGYNQASLLAKYIGRALGVPVYDSVLVRTVNTLPQKNLNPQKRLHNLQKAFSLYPGYEHAVFPFHRILLVDDIYTTGATMEAVTRLLKSHGINEVYIFSICIGKGY